MHIALVHNERAGDGIHSASNLMGMFRAIGHDGDVYDRDAAGLLRVLNSRPDVVVVSGGDGTVARVAVALCGSEIPMFVLPTGTSNNVATSIGVARSSLHNLVERLSDCRSTRLDVWRIAGDGYETSFVEAAGIGVIGTMLEQENRRLNELWRRVRGWLTRDIGHWESTARYVAELLRREPPRWIDVRADGEDLSGEYVTFEAMNIRTIGPRIAFAPDADPGDGWLDLVLIRQSEQSALADSIESRVSVTPPSLATMRRARRVEMDWPAGGTHVDDEHKALSKPRRVAINRHGTVNLLVPA